MLVVPHKNAQKQPCWDKVSDFDRLWTHLGVFRNPVSKHIENSVGSSSPNDEFFVTNFLRITET